MNTKAVYKLRDVANEQVTCCYYVLRKANLIVLLGKKSYKKCQRRKCAPFQDACASCKDIPTLPTNGKT